MSEKGCSISKSHTYSLFNSFMEAINTDFSSLGILEEVNSFIFSKAILRILGAVKKDISKIQ